MEMGRHCVGDKEAVKHLLHNNATNDHVNKRGNTALHFAVRFGLDSIVNDIITAYPAEINRKNVLGNTPLSVAFEEKRTKIASTLMMKRASHPIYHWLTTQGVAGFDALDLIERNYDMHKVNFYIAN